MKGKVEKGKGRITITIDKDLINWLNKQVECKRFGSKSHGVEVALKIIKNKLKKGEEIEYD